MEVEAKYSLNKKLFRSYKEFERLKNNHNKHAEEINSEKKKEMKEYQKLLKENEKIKEELKKKKEEAEKKKSGLNQKNSIKEDTINEVKLKNELKEIEAKNKLDEVKLNKEKEIEKLNWKLKAKFQESIKETEIMKAAREKSNEIELIKLKYESLNVIYNDKEFDELIDIATKRKEEIEKDELDNFKEQQNELADFRAKTSKNLKNLEEKNNLEIKKKQFELENHKLKEYSKFLLEKNENFINFRKKFAGSEISNEKLKKDEVEKAKRFFEQQKYNLILREQSYIAQKQNINAFIKRIF